MVEQQENTQSPYTFCRELTVIYQKDEKEWQDYTSPRVVSLYDAIPEDTAIVLYGAGQVGQAVYEQIIVDGSRKIAAWVDRDYRNMGEKVTSPDSLLSEQGLQYDYVYVAILNETVKEQVKSWLMRECGIAEDKIILHIAEARESQLDERYRRDYEQMRQSEYWDTTHHTIDFDRPYSVTSMICNQSFFDAPFVQYWSGKVHRNFVDLMRATNQLSEQCLQKKVVYHRKLWEFIYICQALYENEMLQKGKKGVAFGVGEECLPDLFASMGCDILATDLSVEEGGEMGWKKTGQNISGDYWKLNQYGFCDKKQFEEKVVYRDVDMNHIPSDIQGYDFCWSACALEHLGGIQAGLDFIKNSLNTLSEGGLAIHTTEYNLYSNERTFESRELSLFRRRDMERLIEELEADGHVVYPMDWHIGTNVVDSFVDLPPYSRKDMHLRLKLQEFPCTSIGIIIRK